MPSKQSGIKSRGFGDKELYFTRILNAEPDPDHYIGTADLFYGFGKEVFAVYDDLTYFYSYDTMSWSVFVFTPLKRIISGTFTGDIRDDLIACESITGDVYLYRSSTEAWELLVQAGESDAMAPIE